MNDVTWYALHRTLRVCYTSNLALLQKQALGMVKNCMSKSTTIDKSYEISYVTYAVLMMF